LINAEKGGGGAALETEREDSAGKGTRRREEKGGALVATRRMPANGSDNRWRLSDKEKGGGLIAKRQRSQEDELLALREGKDPSEKGAGGELSP